MYMFGFAAMHVREVAYYLLSLVRYAFSDATYSECFHQFENYYEMLGRLARMSLILIFIHKNIAVKK